MTVVKFGLWNLNVDCSCFSV